MAKERYRVIQWTTGAIGRIAIRHFVDNPLYELVGVLVTDPGKVGKEAGAIAGTRSTGVLATSDAEAILALDADCVHYAPRRGDLDMICRLLKSGKNVVSPLAYVYPTDYYRDDLERLEEACREGRASIHGTGIHPGFAGDLLPLTIARLASRIDSIHLYETVDLGNKHESWPLAMGFGGDPEDVLAKPGRSPDSIHAFVQSMTMLAEGLDRSVEEVTTRFEVATARRDLDPPFGAIRAGTVAGMHFEWTAMCAGSPLIVYHALWTIGNEIEPAWNCGGNAYRIVVEGDPPIELTLQAGRRHPAGDQGYWGLVWTAMNGINAIPAVCRAAPGLVTHIDLGIVLPRGLVRPRSPNFGEPIGLKPIGRPAVRPA